MSWLFKSFQTDGQDSADSRHSSSPEHSPSTTPRGVKDDFSAIGQTLGRQLRGVAGFLAPPPPPKTAAVESSDPSPPQSQALVGIRNDLAEISGSFRSGLSLLSGNKAVGKISRLASNLITFPNDEVKDGEASEEEDDDYEGVPGLTDEVIDFATEISRRPELWTDFPLPLDEDFNMSDPQKEHASIVERLAPSLADLRVKLQSYMSEGQFWLVYFILLLPRLSEHDAELLSTSEVREARNVLLQRLQKNSQVEDEDSRTIDTSEDGSEDSGTIDTSKDGSKAGKPQGRNIPPEDKEVSSDKLSAGVEVDDEESTEKWLEEKDSDTGSHVSSQKRLVHEEDISFSDLEDDAHAPSNRASGRQSLEETKVSSPSGSTDWVELNRSSDSQCGSGHQKAGQSKSRDKDSEGEESNDWLTVDFD